MKPSLFLLGIFLLLGCPLHATTAYWVWERSKPLAPAEIAGLKGANVTHLYWLAGTLTLKNKAWIWRERFPIAWKALTPSSSGITVIPVLRLEPPESNGLPPENVPQLISFLNNLATTSGSSEIQIDYECPDRLIPNYLDFLKRLKESGPTWRLSISALGHWAKYAGQFKGLADEITPMFYDLNPGRESLAAGTLPPLLDSSACSQIAAWKDCPIPWRAGLPNFSRLTLLNAQGVSRGNIRQWSWDELWLSPLLQPPGATAHGQTRFIVKTSGLLGQTPLQPGESLVVRYPDRSALPASLAALKSAHAEGPIYFRLAGADDMSGFTPQDLAQEQTAAPTFQIKTDASTRITLTNTSLSDLMPRVSGPDPDQRGYCLVLHADAPIWRDVLPGEFARVTFSEDDQSTTLRFWFAHLSAGKSLETGLVERAPGTQTARVTWRIDNLEAQNLWHTLESSSR